MDVQELILSRHSVRDFLQDPIPAEVLAEILEAGRVAPSTQNKQPWRYIVITETAEIKRIAFNCGLIGLSNYFLRKAPCVIIACADMSKNVRLNHQDYYLVDTAISFQQMMLAAWAKGIGSCWLAAFSEKKLRSYLKIPDKWRIVALSPFGYPAEKKSLHAKLLSGLAGSHDRLPIKDIVIRFPDNEKP
ncbi:MAG: nitroreductase family protein [Candidatus Cloacimonadaceae bacterium]|nr:nitroreductase family protein [Candidatus Cloacimonadaceae bacterium]